MIYDIRQVTTCAYASPVAHAHHVLRLTPVNRSGQRVHLSALQIEPPPVKSREGEDFFGNRLTSVTINDAHSTLAVKVSARIAVDPVVLPDPATAPAWETVRDEVFAATDIAPQSPVHFLFASRMVSLDPEIRDYARQSFAPGRSIVEAALDLNHRIKTDMTYEIGATTVTTTAPMSFALRRGVCQDFAHIMIAGLRGLGLPAAYVSGYLRSTRTPEQMQLQGADAMHAWVQVWCGHDSGWIGFDPTNDMIASDDHVVLAVGRDYSDVAPMDGVIVAAGGQRMTVSVSVKPVQPTAALLPQNAL
ncbi:MAG: transglutaminase family protein [Proteobacteria bacterium]|nr:transglutaminase family protein [Pseudomonadota bacterium]